MLAPLAGEDMYFRRCPPKHCRAAHWAALYPVPHACLDMAWVPGKSLALKQSARVPKVPLS